MEMEKCKVAEEQIQVAEHVHYNMGPATQDKQIGHTRGLPLAVGGAVEVGREDYLQLAHGKEVAVAKSYKEEGASIPKHYWLLGGLVVRCSGMKRIRHHVSRVSLLLRIGSLSLMSFNLLKALLTGC
ncbi:hypothetical protein F0562_011131 [Nyssa sinensis]|uniref:Uncharacterized protein n=1 Tax=Nyssa sinensis TaxID=561372 RepID=A0A5J5A3Z3_9ASTE|nr:hypothetical protein F0562_011131 [Nyssa sinensis]